MAFSSYTSQPAPFTQLLDFLHHHQRLFVLTGAGCSTDSGIPDYRDDAGAWKNAQPIQFREFMDVPLRRARYWARSMIGWRRFGVASPNAAHKALAQLEAMGQVQLLVTQNVDRLHQAAGSEKVIDLHGRLDEVRCMQCNTLSPRDELQQRLEQLNPDWLHLDAMMAPDGDALLEDVDFSTFVVPPCAVCQGILKPDVVFFGEPVPRERVDAAYAALEQADGVLVVGSSLMVHSGYRYVYAASQKGLPIAAINRGVTRADALLNVKVSQPCGSTLMQALSALAQGVST